MLSFGVKEVKRLLLTHLDKIILALFVVIETLTVTVILVSNVQLRTMIDYEKSVASAVSVEIEPIPKSVDEMTSISVEPPLEVKTLSAMTEAVEMSEFAPIENKSSLVPDREGQATVEEVAIKVYNGLRAMGYDNNFIAGVFGNMEYESQLRTYAYYGLGITDYNVNDLVNPSNKAHGLVQWTDDRFASLKEEAVAQNKNWYDIDLQVYFMIKELNSDYYQRYLSTDKVNGLTLEQTTNKVLLFYEGCDTKQAIKERIGYAQNWLDLFNSEVWQDYTLICE